MKAAAWAALAGLTCPAQAAEVGVFAVRAGWGDGVFDGFSFDESIKSGGALSDSRSGTATPGGGTLKSYAAGGFHGLAASSNAKVPGGGHFGQPDVGGGAYWFEQITISSPTVPVGTLGTADFTLFFDGELTISPPNSQQAGANSARISYTWAASTNDADNVADPDVGTRETESVVVYSSYTEKFGPNFRNQPRNHQLSFRFGQPFDFTVSLSARSRLWLRTPAEAVASIQLTGWNGFTNVRVRDGAAVTNSAMTSQTGFNYANAGSTTFNQWASRYQLPAASQQMDSNNNGVADLMEYALGRNPLAADRGSPFTPAVMDVGGQKYAAFSFTRPALGARAGDIIYRPQRSTGLSGWSGTGVETTVTPSPNAQTETVTVRSTAPVSSQTSEFLRLEVAPVTPP